MPDSWARIIYNPKYSNYSVLLICQNTGKKKCYYWTDATMQNHLPCKTSLPLSDKSIYKLIPEERYCFWLNSKVQGSISPVHFNGELPEILFTFICPTFPVYVLEILCFMLCVRSWVVSVAQLQRVRDVSHYLTLKVITKCYSFITVLFFLVEWLRVWTKGEWYY